MAETVYDTGNSGMGGTPAIHGNGGQTLAYVRVLEDAFRAEYGRLYRFCNSILRNHADAEDALQEAFMKAWKERDSIRENSNLVPWLNQIVRNSAIDLFRREGIWKGKNGRREYMGRRYVDIAEESAGYHGQPCDARVRCAPDVMYDEELRSRATTRAFQKLEAPYREALLIYAEERKRGRAIAEELGINENTAKVRVFRGKPKLLRRLREEGVTL